MMGTSAWKHNQKFYLMIFLSFPPFCQVQNNEFYSNNRSFLSVFLFGRWLAVAMVTYKRHCGVELSGEPLSRSRELVFSSDTTCRYNESKVSNCTDES